MKLNPASASIVYCTYLGGAVNDTVTAMAVDANGVIYLTGVTASGDLPDHRQRSAIDHTGGG